MVPNEVGHILATPAVVLIGYVLASVVPEANRGSSRIPLDEVVVVLAEVAFSARLQNTAEPLVRTAAFVGVQVHEPFPGVTLLLC